MTKTPDYGEIHKEHRQWLTDLNFYHDELKYYQNQLAQVAARSEIDEQYHQKIIDFKSRFFQTLEKIDRLRYTIYKHEKELADHEKLAERTQIHVNEDHHSKKADFKNFVKDYEELKQDFNNFLEKILG